MKKGTIKRLHVDMHAIRRNIKNETQEPVITVQHRGKSYKGFEVKFEHGVLRQSIKPLSCGARVWIETTGIIILDGIEIV